MKFGMFTKEQEVVIHALKTSSSFTSQFYFTGGTCLSVYYLHHRFSEDLDFFSEKEFNITDITSLLKKLKSTIGYIAIDITQSFNRTIIQLEFSSNTHLKTEFTYFPFHRIDTSQVKNGLQIDSLRDIAANKLFTIAQNPRGRDYFDLYLITQKMGWTLEELRLNAKIKFDWHIDPIQLGTQLIQYKKLKDDPIVPGKIPYEKIAKYYEQEATQLKRIIIS